ncbi:outer membrane assembly protein AsmA [Erwinia persicina]|uniref:outer membrane assembly protein AsmA n=1 Tax=Erwinia persicina TaxID=55211 RepID=UPI002103DB78|nr:outer membrane assembly protein AsmA [Erwinia persicina]MCQ4106174.1 outer membrane assembly protein AsmA [Erwinia persicina]UTX14333.1 outer membrane assembly protein AsmA [Erwinia persicina]
MKRFITTLAILLVVMVAGMTALVVLVNPNDFRAYMVRQVEQHSGYQLALNGELRWHVWPQLSILSGPITLTAPGAAEPVVSAQNMRLDVNLLPLLSHQLSVKQVMLKGAVVRLMPDSERQRPSDAPIGPDDNDDASPVSDITHGWKFDIAHLRIADSLLVWQQSNGEQLNVRDFNLSLDQTQPRLAHLALSSRINRDQRELQISMESDLDITDYPRRLDAVINQLDYQMKGADLPREGVKGSAQMKATWLLPKQQFSLADIQFSANDSQLTGNLSGFMSPRLQISADLHAATLNLDALLGLNEVSSGSSTGADQRSGPAPVVAALPEYDNANSPLNVIDGKVGLSVDALHWRGVQMKNVQLAAVNKAGLMTINTFRGNIPGGSFSLPGTIDVRSEQTKVTVQPDLKQFALTPLLKSLELPDKVSGAISLTGNFAGEGLSVDDVKRHWQGRADLTVKDAQFAGLNLQELVQRAVENNNNNVEGKRSDGQANLQQITGSMALKNGAFTFSRLDAHSGTLNYTGQGTIDVVNRALDFRFGVTVTEGWMGDSTLIKRLQVTPVPLRIYGPWSGINYNLTVDQVLRGQLRDEARERLKKWIDRNPESDKNNDAKKVLKDL